MFKSIEQVLKRASQPITAPFPSVAERKQQAERVKSANSCGDWHAIQSPKMTPELERDLRLLSMRNALDPHHHYKAGEKIGAKSKKPFAVGTIIEGAGEFYSSRLTRRNRTGTLVDTLLRDEEKRAMFKNKYLNLQRKRESGTRPSYQQRREKRLAGAKKVSTVKQERYRK